MGKNRNLLFQSIPLKLLTLPLIIKIQRFYFLARPGCFSKKLKAGLNAGITVKTADVYCISHVFPSPIFHQFLQERLQRYPVKWIVFVLLRISGHFGKTPIYLVTLIPDLQVVKFIPCLAAESIFRSFVKFDIKIIPLRTAPSLH